MEIPTIYATKEQMQEIYFAYLSRHRFWAPARNGELRWGFREIVIDMLPTKRPRFHIYTDIGTEIYVEEDETKAHRNPLLAIVGPYV